VDSAERAREIVRDLIHDWIDEYGEPREFSEEEQETAFNDLEARFAATLAAQAAQTRALRRLHAIGEHIATEHLPAEDEPSFAAHAREFNEALDEARAALTGAPREPVWRCEKCGSYNKAYHAHDCPTRNPAGVPREPQ